MTEVVEPEFPTDSSVARLAGIGSDPSEQRLIGFSADALADAVWLPDDVKLIEAAIEAAGQPFGGAAVPLLLHRPEDSEATYDSAEWAAELIGLQGGTGFLVAPFVGAEMLEGRAGSAATTVRQWNHALAMIERLDQMCSSMGLVLGLNETVGPDPVGGPRRIDPGQPVNYVLDAGELNSQGHLPARLGPPET